MMPHASEQRGIGRHADAMPSQTRALDMLLSFGVVPKVVFDSSQAHHQSHISLPSCVLVPRVFPSR